MQALDRLISLARIEGRLDLRCLLNGPLEVDHASEPLGVSSFHVVLDGQCALRRHGAQDVALVAGDIVLLPRGQAHVIVLPETTLAARQPTTHFNGTVLVRSNVASGVPALDLLCGRFAYASPATLIEALPDIIKVRFTDTSLDLVVSAMRRECEAPLAGSQTIVGAMSTALFAMTLRAWLDHAPELAGVLALLSSKRVGQAVIAMLEHPGKPWSIALLADQAAMSRASFMRSYTNLSTESPLQFLGRVRMQRASGLLTDSNRSIGDVAAEVGYASETAFARKFKEIFAVSPGQYRRDGPPRAHLQPMTAS